MAPENTHSLFLAETSNLDPDLNVAKILELVKEKKLVSDDSPAVDIIDLDYFLARITQLRQAFREPFFHNCFAIKANCLRGVLKAVLDTGFMGAECASIGETLLAHEVGFSPDQIVYNGPVKSEADLKKALELGVNINLDNDHEMEIVDRLMRNEYKGGTAKSKHIGLRINPLVGDVTDGNLKEIDEAYHIADMAIKESKFGIPLNTDTKDKVMALFKKYEWLNSLHCHAGSHGTPMKFFIGAARLLVDFALEVELNCQRKLKMINIGGGMWTDYDNPEEPRGYEYQTYRNELEKGVPELFSGRFIVCTEMGTSLIQKAGKTVTRIGAIKNWLPEVRPILTTYIGSNQFIFEAFLPDYVHHRFDVIGHDGKIKKGGSKKIYDISGVVCHQGDYLSKKVELVIVEKGDMLLMHDTAGYSISMYSKFHSISPTPVYTMKMSSNGEYEMRCIKPKESLHHINEFWGPLKPLAV